MRMNFVQEEIKGQLLLYSVALQWRCAAGLDIRMHPGIIPPYLEDSKELKEIKKLTEKVFCLVFIEAIY